MGDLGINVFSPIRSGCAGVGHAQPTLTRDGGRPRVGNANFALRLDGALPSAVVGLLIDGSVRNHPGCDLASPSPIALVGVADATGSFRLPAPVPLQPSLIGVRLFVQGVALANGGALLGLADLSDAYALVIGS